MFRALSAWLDGWLGGWAGVRVCGCVGGSGVSLRVAVVIRVAWKFAVFALCARMGHQESGHPRFVRRQMSPGVHIMCADGIRFHFHWAFPTSSDNHFPNNHKSISSCPHQSSPTLKSQYLFIPTCPKYQTSRCSCPHCPQQSKVNVFSFHAHLFHASALN